MSLKDAIDKALAEHAGWTAAPYDGVLGSLPDWIPKPLAIEFAQLRVGLLGSCCPDCGVTHAPDQIRTWLTAYRTAMYEHTGFRSVPTFPPAHTHDLRDLAYIQSIASLGPEHGLAAYLGEGADKVYRDDVFAQRQRKISRQPRGDGLGRVINSLLRQKPAREDALPYVIQQLSANEGNEIEGVRIDTMDDDVIEWSDAKTPAGRTLRSALKDRVSRALKKLAQG